MPNEPQKQDDEHDSFDSTAGVMAYVYAKEGAKGLKALLAIHAAEREMLERDAEELMAVGLPAVAEIVLEAATNTLPPMNPFNEATDPANYRDWNRRHLGVWQGYLKTEDSERKPNETSPD